MSEPSPEDFRAAKKPRADQSQHRLLPCAPEAERGYLSSVLQAPAAVLDEVPLPSEAFHLPAHRAIHEQLAGMHADRQPIDFITLGQRLADRQLLDAVGGHAYITELFTFLGTASHVRQYAGILAEKHTRRELIKLCTEIAARGYDDEGQPAKDLNEDLVTRAVDIAAGGTAEDTIKPVSSFAQQALAEIEYAYDNRGRTVGIPTGFVDFDRMTGGWQKGFTYYFGARPAMGKSSLGLNFASNTAAHTLKLGCPVLFFSVEMTGVQLAKRLIFTLSQINQQRARDGFLSERDFPALAKACDDVVKSRLFIDETAALTIADFRARARRWVKKIRRQNGERKDGKPDGMIWIDYLQRMKGSSKRAEDARYLELQEIAQGISQVAKDLQVPIAILAQLKRPKDKKPDTEPDMTEFRECGDIEQEAHVVALIHRPHYYVKGNEDKQAALAEQIAERWQKPFTVEDLKRYAKLIIDKQREGPVGSIDLRFVADYTEFSTWDKDRKAYSNNPEERQQTEDE